ncbi:MAG: beta-hydroxyacyl-ACP dehydratase [Prevotella sp.]
MKGYYYDVEKLDMGQAENPAQLLATCHVRLRDDCDIYRGHFPHQPICPGVCNIQMILECCELATNKKLRIAEIRKCRFPTLATPENCGELLVKIELLTQSEDIDVRATITDGSKNYVELHGTLKENQL